jgi:hypothetical protein
MALLGMHRGWLGFPLFLLLTIAWVSQSPNAQNLDRDQLALAAVLPTISGQGSCFRRVYDGRHLGTHPDQLVTSMRVAVENRSDNAKDHEYSFVLAVTMRGRSDRLNTSGSCRWRPPSAGYGNTTTEFLCTVDCDGGGFALEAKRGDNALFVRLGPPFHGVGLSSSCGEDTEHNVLLNPGKDDRLFRLEKAAPGECSDDLMGISIAMPAPPPFASTPQRCVVADPTGSDLNLRQQPAGHAIGKLRNGAVVFLGSSHVDRQNRVWVEIKSSVDAQPQGWVFLSYLRCDN